MSVVAPAKINLYLEIVGRRTDGYHDLRSVVVPVDICDEIELLPADTVTTEVTLAPGFPSDPNCMPLRGLTSDDNLTTRAARLLQAHAGVSKGVLIRLNKAIPVGGGLGGGSSDAAAVLHGVNTLWELGLSTEELAALGSQLGADIPALVHGRALVMEGRGERVTPLTTPVGSEFPDWWVVMVNPCVAVSTSDIYRRLRLPLTQSAPDIKSMVCALTSGDLDEAVFSLRNDLQATVFEKYPVIALLCGWLQAAGAPGVLVSGSGASVFGLVPSRGAAERVQIRLDELAETPVWSRVARLLPDGVMVAHGPLEA